MAGAVSKLPDTVPSAGIFIVDTAALFAALMGEGHRTHKLRQVCSQLGIETEYLHNAGNDAYVSFLALSCFHFTCDAPRQYTLRALREMASGGPLDTQKEFRWPTAKSVPTALTVQLPDDTPAPGSDEDNTISGGDAPNTGVPR